MGLARFASILRVLNSCKHGGRSEGKTVQGSDQGGSWGKA